MAKNITDKYSMEFSMAEFEITTPVKLSATEFKKRMALAMKKYEESQNYDSEFQFHYHKQEYDQPSFTCIYHYFTLGCSDFVLIEMHCKEGYRFTK